MKRRWWPGCPHPRQGAAGLDAARKARGAEREKAGRAAIGPVPTEPPRGLRRQNHLRLERHRLECLGAVDTESHDIRVFETRVFYSTALRATRATRAG